MSGREITSQLIESFLQRDHELRFFEVKGPGDRTDKACVAGVARAAMAMGNLRDGGIVCLGIDETSLADMQPGLDASQVAQWSSFDDVSSALATYCDPPVSFDLHSLTLGSGAVVIVLEVSEFDHSPHVCKKGYPDKLKVGQVYVRPRGKPESIAVPSSADMRELLDAAIDKGVREFVRRATAAGLTLQEGRPDDQENLDQESYNLEREQAWKSPLSNAGSRYERELFGVRGFTDVSIRPAGYNLRRLRPNELEPMLLKHVVRLRGWPMPMVDLRNPIARHGTWIGQDVAPSSLVSVPVDEAWRLFTSGHFLHRRVLGTDLGDVPVANLQPTSSGAVAVSDVLLYLAEVVEFAARWSAAIDCSAITLEVSLMNVGGRELIAGDHRRHLSGPYRVSSDSTEIDADLTISAQQLLADTRGVGVRLTQQLLQQFGASIDDDTLLEYQSSALDSQ